MDKIYFQDKSYDKIDFTESPVEKGEYENCRFMNCDFSNSDLSDIHFTDCEFSGCNLSMAKLTKTALKNIHFINSKLIGLHFDDCNQFLLAFVFENCILNLSSFYKLKLKKTIFKNTTLHEVDFTYADLSGSVFDNCDLARSIFFNTVLEKADFRNAINFSIDPDANKIKRAKFSLSGIPGLLDKYDIEIE